MEAILGVVNEFEAVASADPQLAAAYQSIVSPTPGVADRVSVPVPHRELLVAVGAEGNKFTVAITGVRVELTHPPLPLDTPFVPALYPNASSPERN